MLAIGFCSQLTAKVVFAHVNVYRYQLKHERELAFADHLLIQCISCSMISCAQRFFLSYFLVSFLE